MLYVKSSNGFIFAHALSQLYFNNLPEGIICSISIYADDI